MKAILILLSVSVLAQSILTAGGVLAPNIVTQPVSITVGENENASFSVVAAGDPPLEYQWRADGVDIPGEVGDTLSGPATLDLNGVTFSVTVTNPSGTALSDGAVLTVIPDLTPPHLVSARGGDTLLQIILEFDEPLEFFSATDPFNYAVTPFLEINQVAFGPDDRTVVLTITSPLQPGTLYVVEAFFIADLASANNANPGDSIEFLSCSLETYVGAVGDFSITTDNGALGLDVGDEVTWNGPGGPVAGLVFGTTAFISVQDAADATCDGGTVHFTATAPGAGGPVDAGGKSLTLIGDGSAQKVACFDFDDGLLPSGTRVFGDAAASPDRGVGDSGMLALTEALTFQRGAWKIDDFTGGQPLQSLDAVFKVRLGDSTCCTDGVNPRPADGFSLSFAPDLPEGVFANPEEGAGSGLRVSFDTWDNLTGGVEDTAPAIEVLFDGVAMATVSMAEPRDGGGPPVTIIPTDPATGEPMLLTTGADYANVRVHLDPDGTVDVWYKDVLVLDDVATPYTPAPGDFAFGARTGGATETHFIDDLCLTTSFLTGPVNIVSQPQSQTTESNHSVTYSVVAELVGVPNGGLSFRWQVNGVDIPGATGSSYTLPLAALADDGNVYTVIVTGPLDSVVSNNAGLTVILDTTPPQLVSARGSDTFTQITVEFDELVDPLYAEDPFNYIIDGSLTVQSSTLQADGRTVVLTTTPQQQDTIYTVEVFVTDLAGNFVDPNSTVQFHSFVLSCGFVKQELWFDIGGVLVSDLTSDPDYPNSPDLVSYIPSIEGPLNAFDNYGTRLSGYVLPHVTGPHSFYLNSDDRGEFRLSTDINPSNLTLIANEPFWNNPREYTSTFNRNAAAPENRSDTLFPGGIPLVAGQPYFFEALAKEGGGGDNLSLAWQQPGGPAVQDGDPPIGGVHVGVAVDPVGAGVSVTQQPQDFLVVCSVPAPFDEDFDSGDGEFVVQNQGNPTGPWTYGPGAGIGGTGAWFLNGTDNNGAPSHTRLTSPTLAVIDSGPLVLSFDHRYSFEAGLWDAGAVFVSVNGGPFTQIPNASFTANGYTGFGLIGNHDLNGGEGFNGDSPGYGDPAYIRSVVALGNFNAGDHLAFQWLGAFDQFAKGTEPNWELDNIAISNVLHTSTATFTVDATGFTATNPNHPTFIQWERSDDNGVSWTLIPGANEADYTTLVEDGDFGALFRARIYVPGHLGISDAARLIRGNCTPIADAGGPYVISEGDDLLLYSSDSNDLDGDPLSYSWDVNGDGVFGDATGPVWTLTWTQLVALGIVDGPASFTVTVQVSDGMDSSMDSATLTLNNRAPQVSADPPSQVVECGTAIADVTISATDAPLDGMTAEPLTGGLQLVGGSNQTSPATWALQGGATLQPGIHEIDVSIEDKDGGIGTVRVTITVQDTTPPDITLLGANPQTIECGTSYVELGATAADNCDGDLTGAIDIDASAVITSAEGSYAVTYDVVDSAGNAATTVTRTVNVVNAAPVLDPIGPQSVDEQTDLTFTATATDPNPFTFTLEDGQGGAVPSGASITPQGVFSWTPSEADGPGMFTFDVVVTDACAPPLSSRETITVTVNEVNVNPVVTDAEVAIDEVAPVGTFVHQVVATDTDIPANTLSHAITDGNVGNGFDIDSVTGEITVLNSGPLDFETMPQFVLEVTVTDDGTPQKSGVGTITVNLRDQVEAFTEQNGQVVMEAENFDFNEAQGAHQWVERTHKPDYLGDGFMCAEPNIGARIKDSKASTLSPKLTYRIDFTETGRYYLWVRGRGTNGSDNSVYVGLDGDLDDDEISLNDDDEWEWDDLDDPLIINTPGVHEICVWMREDGTYIDRLLLSKDEDFDPNDEPEQPESMRDGQAFNTPPTVAIVSPVNQATFDVNDPVTIEFDAMDPDGEVVQVEVFVDGALLATLLPPATSTVFIPTIEDLFDLTAVATDNDGAQTTSALVKIKVGSPATAQPFAEQGGLVVIEAESFEIKVAGTDGHQWVERNDKGGFEGAAALRAEPNIGTRHGNKSDATALSPKLSYLVFFETLGKYEFWVRGLGENGSDNSVWVGIDGVVQQQVSFSDDDEWDWRSKNVDIDTPGLHELCIWMREDGTYIDRLLLSTEDDDDFDPEDEGFLPESPRVPTVAPQLAEDGSQFAPNMVRIVAGTELSYGEWQAQELGNGEVLRGQGEDPDRDGLTNLAEYAFGLDPLQPDRGNPLAVRWNEDDLLEFYYSYAPRAVDVELTMEGSRDLLEWTPVENAERSNARRDRAGQVQATYLMAAEQLWEQPYYRLRVRPTQENQ